MLVVLIVFVMLGTLVVLVFLHALLLDDNNLTWYGVIFAAIYSLILGVGDAHNSTTHVGKNILREVVPRCLFLASMFLITVVCLRIVSRV